MSTFYSQINMHKGTIEITNKGLGFKLINSISFGESLFFIGLF